MFLISPCLLLYAMAAQAQQPVLIASDPTPAFTEEQLSTLLTAAVRDGVWEDVAKCVVARWGETPFSEMPDVFPPRPSHLLRVATDSALEHCPRLRFDLGSVRDGLTAKIVRNAASLGQVCTWLDLNLILGDADGLVVDWFDKQKSAPSQLKDLQTLREVLDPLLRRRGRWTDLPLLYENPAEAVRLMLSPPPGMTDKAVFEKILNGQVDSAPGDAAAELNDGFARAIIRSACELYAGLLAAHRNDEASEAASIIRRACGDKNGRVVMIHAAIEARAVIAAHLEWLDNAVVEDPSLVSLREQAHKVFQQQDTEDDLLAR